MSRDGLGAVLPPDGVTMDAYQRDLARQAQALEGAVLTWLRPFPEAAGVFDSLTDRITLTVAERVPAVLADLQRQPLSEAQRWELGEMQSRWHQVEALRWTLARTVWGLIARRAHKLASMSRLSEEDLLQEGLTGAYRAAHRYRPEQQAFTTYAAWWIKAAMTRAMDKAGSLVRVPGGAREQRRNLNRLAEQRAKHCLPTTDEALAEATGLDLERVRLVRRNHLPTSIEAPLEACSSSAGDALLSEVLVDESPLPDEQAENCLLLPRVWQRIGILSDREHACVLTERERTVLVLRFGLGGDPPLTLAAVAASLEPPLSRERVRQIERVALRKLRQALDPALGRAA